MFLWNSETIVSWAVTGKVQWYGKKCHLSGVLPVTPVAPRNVQIWAHVLAKEENVSTCFFVFPFFCFHLSQKGMIRQSKKKEEKSSKGWQESLIRDPRLMNWETEKFWYDSVIMWRWRKHRTMTDGQTNPGWDCRQQIRQQFVKNWMNTKVMKWRYMHQASIRQDSKGHRDFLLRRIVLKFWYQHWTFIRELSWSSAHDYLLCLPEKQDHTHRWNPGHAHLWENDQRTPFTLWGLRSVNCWGQKRPQGLDLKKTVVCLPALFCSSAVWPRMVTCVCRVTTLRLWPRDVYAVSSVPCGKDLFILITIRELFKFLLYKMIYCIILFLFLYNV